MAMSKAILHKHYLRALSRWPTDPLRPETQFSDIIRQRVDKSFGYTSSSPLTDGLTKEAAGKDGQIGTTIIMPFDAIREADQVNALYSLVEGRYGRKHQASSKLLKPKSNPTYYTDLITELEAAPSRGFWDRIANRWKGFLRFK